MTSPLTGRTALVTGASRGIGRAITLRLASAGARVFALARDGDALLAVAAAARDARSDATVTPLPCDLTDRDAVRVALASCSDVSIVINNAGWAAPRSKITRSRLDDWQRTLDTCLYAPMTIVHALLPAILHMNSGAIVQILSAAAKRGRAGEAAYAAAKAGLRGFTESLREELQDTDIKVSSIYPGYVDTAFIPANRKIDRSRFLQPDDVASAVMHCLESTPQCCPAEIVLEPQRSEQGRGAWGVGPK